MGSPATPNPGPPSEGFGESASASSPWAARRPPQYPVVSCVCLLEFRRLISNDQIEICGANWALIVLPRWCLAAVPIPPTLSGLPPARGAHGGVERRQLHGPERRPLHVPLGDVGPHAGVCQQLLPAARLRPRLRRHVPQLSRPRLLRLRLPGRRVRRRGARLPLPQRLGPGDRLRGLPANALGPGVRPGVRPVRGPRAVPPRGRCVRVHGELGQRHGVRGVPARVLGAGLRGAVPGLHLPRRVRRWSGGVREVRVRRALGPGAELQRLRRRVVRAGVRAAVRRLRGARDVHGGGGERGVPLRRQVGRARGLQ